MKRIFFLLVLFVGLLLGNPSFSQPSDPPGGGGGGGPVTNVPFGVEWLLVAGIAYGSSKLRRKPDNQ